VVKNYVTEFIGTFFLVATIGFTALNGTPLAPLAIGSALMIMVYMGGHISGGHYNPAVTLAVFLRGKLAAKEVAPYMIMQLLGAVVAALAVHWLTGRGFAPEPSTEVTKLGAVAAEFIFTFALALVVLNTATATKTAGNSYFGLAIGFTIGVGAFSVGGLSGGAFNPAVGTGPAIVRAALDGGSLAMVWIYLAGPFLGGAAAAYVFKLQNPGD
jgi:aquaporin Z